MICGTGDGGGGEGLLQWLIERLAVLSRVAPAPTENGMPETVGATCGVAAPGTSPRHS